MNRPRLTAGLLAIAGLAVFAPGMAAAQSQHGPYLAAGVGYDWMPDRDLNINGFGVSSQWKPGAAVFAAVGYRLSPSFRVEVEGSGRDAKVKAFNDVNPWAGKQWDNSVMVNVLYDVNIKDLPVTPYVGGGLGATWIIWGDNFRATKQNPPTIYDADSWRGGWQGIVGVSYNVSPKITVAVDGRIHGSFGDYKFPGSVAGRQINQFSQLTQTVFVSARYSFGSP